MTSVDYLFNLINSNEKVSQKFILKSREFLAIKSLEDLKQWIKDNKCSVEYKDNEYFNQLREKIAFHLIEKIYKDRDNKWNGVIEVINIC